MKKLLKQNATGPQAWGALLAFSLFFQPFSANAQTATGTAGVYAPVRSISVAGEATGEFAPDQAVIRFSVNTRGKVLANAKKANDEKLAALVKVAEDFSIPKEKVVPSGVFISPEYHYQEKGKPQLAGYSVNRQLSITTKDLSRQEELLSALVDINVDQVNNVEFQLATPEDAASGVRVRAFENARARAEALAKAAGVKLGPVITIHTEGSMNTPRPPMPMMAMARAESADMSVAPSLPGSITVREQVHVTFGLE